MLKVIQTAERNGRTYHLAETGVGKILFYEFGDYTQYKNLTNHDICWSIKSTDEFNLLFHKPAIQILASKRIKGMKTIHKFKVGDCHFYVHDNNDGYYYVIDHSLLRIFSEKKYPNAKFVYQLFHKQSLRNFDYLLLRRTFEEETAKFNGDYSVAPYIVSSILDEVYKLVNESIEEVEETQISLF